MPTYEYQCKECHDIFEVFHLMTDLNKRPCPKCGSIKTKRKIGAGSGIIFKGSGFYKTDNRNK